MSEWKKVRLGDVCEIPITDGTHQTPAYAKAEDGIPFLSSKDVTTQTIDWNNIKYITKELHETLYKRISPQKDDVLLAKNGTTGVAALVEDNRVFDIYVTLALLRPNQEIIYPKYLLRVINSPSCKRQFNSHLKGVGVPNLHLKEINETKIPLPPLETQKHIAAVLDKCSALIAKHKLMLEKYDTLIKSRFIEMFGDPVQNPKKWNIEKLKTLTSKIGSGATPKGGRESYISEGISLVRSMNVYKGYFEYEGLAHITEDQARELDNVTLQENDVLINITGASVARCCILPKDVLPARVNQHVSILRATEKLNPVYLSNLLITDTEQRVLLGIGGAGGATREAITKTELETLDIPVPPLSLQNNFAAFVQQIDKSKFEIANSLKRLYNKGMLS